jgi:hypothetical protein
MTDEITLYIRKIDTTELVEKKARYYYTVEVPIKEYMLLCIKDSSLTYHSMREWCDKTFGDDKLRYYFDPVTYKSLQCSFRDEKDAMWCMLRWGGKIHKTNIVGYVR